jgi:putative ABC transport system substrate-binding protein
VPRASAVAGLVNPTNANADNQSNELKEAARTLGLELHVLNAASEGEIDMAFASLQEIRAGALVVASDPFFFSRHQQLIALAARRRCRRFTNGEISQQPAV